MCGICGILDVRGVVPDGLQRMVDALEHRGPDDSGTRTWEQVGLGHRRLSIIDLDGGHQPMSNEDGSARITFNGEIYNDRELRREPAPRHELRTHSDTEVLLHLYEEEGEACLKRLRGMFAFAIWQRDVQELFIARDRLGIQPLYLSRTGARLRFAWVDAPEQHREAVAHQSFLRREKRKR